MNLRGKAVLVTGGARRIGAAIVRALAAEGAEVVIHCNRSITAANDLARAIRATGGRASVVQADLLADRAANQLFDATLAATGGRLDGVVNAASEYLVADAGNETAAARMARLHVEAPKRLVERLAALGGDAPKAAVNITDARIVSADPAHAAYLESKRRLDEATRALAATLAPRCRVNAVAPGIVLPPDGAPEGEAARLAQFNPMKACGSPEGLAKCVVFLLENDFITGHTIRYDGGYALNHTPPLPRLPDGMDAIAIRGLRLNVFLGVYEEELKAPRPVVVDVALRTDLAKAAASDDLADTIDYHALAARLRAAVEPQPGDPRPVFHLIETLAEKIAATCLDFDARVEAATVAVAKPAAFPGADAASVEITRRR